jgi:hypothetical protein
MTDLETSLRDALDEMATTGATSLPPIERVYEGARRRKRRRLVVRAALVALTGAIAAAAIIQRSDSSRLEVANPSGSVLTPLTARLLPQDTLGMQLSSVLDPADVEIQAGRVTVQLWGRDDVQLAIRTWRSGGYLSGGGTREMVPVSGWTFPAEVITYPSGAIVVVVSENSLMVEIASRTLDRAHLLAIASSINVRDSGGVDLDPTTVPPDFKPMGEDTMVFEPGAYLSYGYPNRAGAMLGVSVRSQTAAGRAFDRLVEPPAKTERVGDKIADIYSDQRSRRFAVVWVAAPDVQVRIEVEGSGSDAQNEALALRAARSIRTVDEDTWREVLDTEIERDDTSVTTTMAGTGTIGIDGRPTTR